MRKVVKAKPKLKYLLKSTKQKLTYSFLRNLGITKKTKVLILV